jgi:predicted dehydrogenase
MPPSNGTSLRVLVVGAGNMGASHARAYSQLPGFQIAGIVTRTEASRTALAKDLGHTSIPLFSDFHVALKETRPDAVCIASYPDTHAEFALAALDAGSHVFVEKPLADSVMAAERVVAKAKEKNLKVVVGYILRHHPTWEKFIEVAKGLGSPLVMRMSLNQQSSGPTWTTHKNLMMSTSPIVDCGVHYVDVMCQMTGSKPIRVSGIGARLSDEIAPTMYNYGHLQVTFEDGSVGTLIEPSLGFSRTV